MVFGKCVVFGNSTDRFNTCPGCSKVVNSPLTVLSRK